jgi:hypothetical protein
MPKRLPHSKLYEWHIVRIRATPAVLVVYVQAADEEQAIKEAIARHGIGSPQRQARLTAQRVPEINLKLV